jgi:hypothetical protein
LVPRKQQKIKSKQKYELSKQTQRLPLNQINKSLDELNENSSQISKTRMNVISNKYVFEGLKHRKKKTSKKTVKNGKELKN